MIATELPVGVYQSRWGYHPVNWEDHKKIKLLHKHYWKAKTVEAAYKRYHNKEPQNRVIRKQNKILLTKPIPMPMPNFPSIYVKILKKPIVPLYQQSRHPQENPESVGSLIISMNQVNEWLSEIEQI